MHIFSMLPFLMSAAKALHKIESFAETCFEAGTGVAHSYRSRRRTFLAWFANAKMEVASNSVHNPMQAPFISHP